MDISSILKCVTNLDQYISITQDIVCKYSNSSILFNMSTVLSLKKIKPLEIEFFNKCDGNGAAIIVLELILRHPPSKTWSLLGMELISIMQYWLEAIRKHLIFHNNYWWNFTSTLISFIEKICQKSKTIPDILIQETAECLLDLATNNKTDLEQCYQIIHCFNVCCAECSRATRIDLRKKLDPYLARVAGAVRACGDARVQLAGTQTLVRWTLPRSQRAARAAAAAAWFEPHRYPPRALAAFVEVAWRNFPQEARKFLNAVNEEGLYVVSLRCRSCTVGGAELVTAEGGEHWLDASTGSRSLALHRIADDAAVLLLADSDIHEISLHREGEGAALHVQGASAVHVQLRAEPRALRRLHSLLRATFAHRYTTSEDFDSTVQAVAENKIPKNADLSSKVRTRASGWRSSRVGYVSQGFVRAASAAPLSPSTASTSSLLMLRDKLSAFPGVVYDKEPVAVLAAPQLSDVAELTEPTDPGVRVAVFARAGRSGFSRDTRHKNESISPVIEEDESNVSCLHVATAGTDESASDAPACPRSEPAVHVDLVESLAREGLQYRGTSPAHAAPPRSNPDTDREVNVPPIKQKQTIVSNTTTDESNTEFVENTPLCVAKRIFHFKNEMNENLNFDNRDVEDFFSQHLVENGDRVSPALARRINRGSSDSSGPAVLGAEREDDRFEVDEDVLECLNKVLNIVCKNLEKCAGYLRIDTMDHTLSEHGSVKRMSEDAVDKNDAELSAETASKKIKLKFDSKTTKVVKKGKPKKKNNPKPTTRSNVENENLNIVTADNVIEAASSNNCNEVSAHITPKTRRKRKLYSPKDDHMIDKAVARLEGDSLMPRRSIPDADNQKIDTPYKEIESIRNKSLMNSRSKGRTPRSILSPRAKRLDDIFEGLKNTIEGETNITFAARNTRNKSAVYNFSSDSDNEDFREKKNEIPRTIKKESKRKRPTTSKTTKGRKVTTENTNPRKKTAAGGQTRKRAVKKSADQRQLRVRLEQMRAASDPAEPLEVSFRTDRNVPDDAEPAPTITTNPKMEKVPMENQGLNIPNPDKSEDRDVTTSPLPGLIIEEVRIQKDCNSASICILEDFNISANKNVSPLNSTHNMKSDFDRSPPLEHHDAISIATSNGSRIGKKRQLSTRKKKLHNIATNRKFKTIASKSADASLCVINLDTTSEKSIATFGKSPITAHGDFDETPPSARLLEQPVTERRGVEAADLTRALKDYYKDLHRAIEVPPGDCGSLPVRHGRQTAAACRSRDASTSKLSPVVSIAKLSPDALDRWMPPRLNSIFGSDQSSSDGQASRTTAEKVGGVRPTNHRARDARRDRASMISPILSFGDCDARCRNKSRSSSLRGSGSKVRRAGDDLFKALRGISAASSCRYDLRSSRKERPLSDGQSKRTVLIDDFRSETEISSKRKCCADEETSSKRSGRSQHGEDADRNSTSSVGEWISRHVAHDAPGVSATVDVSARDNIDAVLEKLDTTLQEIHYNTSKKLASMFVELGRSCAKLQAERENACRETMRDVLAEFVKIIDTKFTDLEARCAAQGAAWERGLRLQARDVLRDDCRQKRDMLALLRDDLLASRPRTQTN